MIFKFLGHPKKPKVRLDKDENLTNMRIEKYQGYILLMIIILVGILFIDFCFTLVPAVEICL